MMTAADANLWELASFSWHIRFDISCMQMAHVIDLQKRNLTPSLLAAIFVVC